MRVTKHDTGFSNIQQLHGKKQFIGTYYKSKSNGQIFPSFWEISESIIKEQCNDKEKNRSFFIANNLFPGYIYKITKTEQFSGSEYLFMTVLYFCRQVAYRLNNYTKPKIMKKNICRILFFIIAFMGFSLGQLEAQLSKTEMPPHPRLLLFNGEEAIIRQTIASSAFWEKTNQSILSWSDTLLKSTPVERIKTGKRLLGPARECLLRVCYLSYSFRMTKDEKYLKRAEKEMLAAAAFTDWNPSHFLDVAEFTMALAIGYDWLYNDLSEKSRETIRNAIIQKGLEPSFNKEYTSWLSRPDNWNQVCNTGMSYGALAIYEDEPEMAEKIISRAIETLSLPMNSYNPDGIYSEGYGYWGYGTTFQIMFLSAVEKVFKTDFGLLENKGFLKTAAFMNNMSGPSGEAFNYSDNSPTVELHPSMFWFANKLKDNSILWSEKHLFTPDNITLNKFLPMSLIWGAGIDLKNIPEPKEKMWVGRGETPVALMRTSWTDPNALFIGMKGGTGLAGHSHLDIGSFVMESDGVRWAMDFGPQNYNSIESRGIDLWSRKQESQRWQLFRYNNFAHNTLTINDKLQQVEGHAPLIGHDSSENFMNATFDLSEVYNGQLLQAKRGIAIVNQNYVVIRDELVNLEHKSTVRWTMLTSAEVSITGTNTIELKKDGKKLILKVQEPVVTEMKTWTTTSPNDYDAPNPGTTRIGFEVNLLPGEKKALTVFLIPEKSIEKIDTDIKSLEKWN